MKPRPSLIPAEAILEVAKVFEYGAKKYPEIGDLQAWRLDNRTLMDHYDAAFRHVLAWGDGSGIDADSELSHAAHAAARLLIVVALEMRKQAPYERSPYVPPPTHPFPFNPADDLCTEGRKKEDGK